MLSGSKIEGGTQNISPGLRMTIETLKEVAKGHSEADIYATLKESNMDPNETFQKLYHQDTFHEVRRRRDRRKEVVNVPRVHIESTGHKIQEDRKEFEYANVDLKPNTYLHRNNRRGPYKRNPLSGNGVNREFRVVKDNRINRDTDKDTLEHALSELAMPTTSLASSKGSSNTKVSGGDDPHASNELISSHPLSSMDANVTANNGNLQMGAMKQKVSKPRSTTSSNNSVLGVYSSSMDPVHVPSHGSRSATNVGAIKRDVGVVGARRQTMESSANNNPSSSQGGLSSNSHAGQHRPPSRGNPRSFGSFSKSDQYAASVSSSHPNGRSFSSYQHNPRPNQSVVHQKSAQPVKEWKPKVSQKLGADASEPCEKPGKSSAPASSRPNHLEEETSKLQDKVSRINISENVIIAPHLRVSESEKYCLTFGSLDADFISSKTSAEEHNVERSESLPVSVSDYLREEPGADSNQLVLGDDIPQNSGSSSPVPGSISVPPQIDKKEPSAPPELDNYSDVGLVRDATTSFESQRHPDVSDLPCFSVYDPQTGYDLTYFRPNTSDEAVRGHGLLSSQEALISHTGSSISSSSIGMVQQVQQQQLQQQAQAATQMYPQVHLPHFTSIMPYRQFISPVYVPPMAVQGYSGNPAFSHHPSNGSSYVLMPGATSHLTASGGLKYGMHQYKPVPPGGQTGFGSFTSPTGYAMNAPGVIGSATGLDDSARLKFKDANLYVPNPQAETSEIWMNAREVVPNMQTASYFNMPSGQAPHAGPATYMASPHGGHPSFNAAAVAQSSHMQFPLYHHQPPQPTMLGNPHHHMGGSAVGGNVGVGIAAAGNPGGAYQQPQLGHLNWTTGNF